MAAEAADIGLVLGNPLDIAGVIDIARSEHIKMTQTLAWAVLYNLIALPVAAGVLFRGGILLSPITGALIMLLSLVWVGMNAWLSGVPEKESRSQARQERMETLDTEDIPLSNQF